jgi:hypothetical protein
MEGLNGNKVFAIPPRTAAGHPEKVQSADALVRFQESLACPADLSSGDDLLLSGHGMTSR